MSNFTRIVASLIAAATPLAAAGAAVLGPHAEDCDGNKPAMLVRIEGLKSRTGTLRVQSYGGNPSRYFDKGSYLERVQVRVPSSGPIEVCMPVAKPGLYAISVKHDANGNGSTDLRNDGGGFSGNPDVSLFDAIFKRKPSPAEVQIHVTGLTPVPVILNYVHGTSVGPISGAR
jgi:uncharacterized protein (DUF2141 family)